MEAVETVPGQLEQKPARMDQVVIRIRNLSKYYKYYDSEFDRVREILTGRLRFRKNVALHDLSLDVHHGEVLGVVGKNGAGKSTLLKILANTMQPSAGEVEVHGRIAALLELGASFHPEMTGHENIYLNCAILGLKKAEIDAVYEDIVEFSGVRSFIHRPVKTYSSGMFVRLAFSIATHVSPDILIIDEALSVGDGVFARKSFDRIMDFKDAGKTILFCTHSLYQIEAICDRVLWIEGGHVKALGEPAAVVTDYGQSLRNESPRQEKITAEVPLAGAQARAEGQPENSGESSSGNETGNERGTEQQEGSPGGQQTGQPSPGQASAGSGENAAAPRIDMPRILKIRVRADGQEAASHLVHSTRTDIEVEVVFSVSRQLPTPSVAIAITGGDGRILGSVGTLNDGQELRVEQGDGGPFARATVKFPRFPLLKGRYNVDAYLLCEKGLHVYEAVIQAAELNVQQQGLARGLVYLPHEWL